MILCFRYLATCKQELTPNPLPMIHEFCLKCHAVSVESISRSRCGEYVGHDGRLCERGRAGSVRACTARKAEKEGCVRNMSWISTQAVPMWNTTNPSCLVEGSGVRLSALMTRIWIAVSAIFMRFTRDETANTFSSSYIHPPRKHRKLMKPCRYIPRGF